MTGLTDRSGESTSLAACQKDAIAPTRAGIAVHVVCGVARELAQAVKGVAGKPAVHGNLAPEHVVLGYDGSIAIADAAAPSRRVDTSTPSRSKPAYLAPEQVSGGDVDRRADVFSLGVVLWELLTGTNLFARETASETRIAIVEDPILDVRDVNPDVPAIVADVLATALQRDRNARFDTPEAFCKALAGAASSSGIADPSKQELAAWIAERAPRARNAPPRPGSARPAGAAASPATTASAAATAAPVVAPPAHVPDLDVPGASRASRSFPKMEAVKAPLAPDLGHGSIPAFDTNAMAAAALAPSTRPPAMSAPPSSGRGSSPVLPAPALGTAVRASTPSAPSAPAQQPGGGRSIAFDGGDDDDFDMEIERNVASTSLPTAQSSRSSGAHNAARSSGGHRVAGTGLELAAPSRMAREASAREEEHGEPGLGIKALGLALATIVGGGTAVALWRYVHHAGGFDVTRAMPHAFDGTSATESGAISLGSLVLALIVGFVGLRFKPHAWAVVAAGGTILLLALAMVTVTLASTGENPTPPDGALLVPYLFPAAVLMVAVGVKGRAARLFAAGHGARRAAFVPIAAIAGAIAFFAFEASRFAR